MNPSLLYIDEEPHARDLHARRLQKSVGKNIEVIAVAPEPTLDAMVKKIEEQISLVSVVIDQKLTAKGTANYIGTELAEKIRLSDQLMPLYILTNYARDVDQNLPSIEYVLNKDDLQDATKLDAIGTRIRRHVDVFQEILNKRERRFEELLRKRFEGNQLNENEIKEFSEIKYQRERKSFVSNVLESDELTQKIEAAEKKLQDLENLLKK